MTLPLLRSIEEKIKDAEMDALRYPADSIAVAFLDRVRSMRNSIAEGRAADAANDAWEAAHLSGEFPRP